jgi:hypothetical protein
LVCFHGSIEPGIEGSVNVFRNLTAACLRERCPKRLENLRGPIKITNATRNIMSHNHPTESKRLLSHVIAGWACSLKYEDLSSEAIQAAKLFWFDSIGCALGGSQQDDAKILLKDYRSPGRSGAPGGCRIRFPESPLAVNT